MARIEISSDNPFGMSYSGDIARNLSVENYADFCPPSNNASSLMRTAMVMHLVAPEFPPIIKTNFRLENKILIDEMYKFYGKRVPKIVATPPGECPQKAKEGPDEHFDVANAHSGGLDSAYRAVKMIASGEKVVAVHVRNLNAKANYLEARASRAQAEAWGIPYKEVHLKNGSKNTGFSSMRSRDIFLATSAVFATDCNGVNEVFVEGDFLKRKKGAHFTEYQGTWKLFNGILRKNGVDARVTGMDGGDIETVEKVLALEKTLGIKVLDLVQNCFSAEYQKSFLVKKWQRETPQLALASSEHWCGSCLKCRRMTIGRLYYHDPKFEEVPIAEVEYFVNDTYHWMKKYEHNSDLISKSFTKHLKNLLSVR